MKNNFVVETYLTSQDKWIDSAAFTTITGAIDYYEQCKKYSPNSEFRVIQLFEI